MFADNRPQIAPTLANFLYFKALLASFEVFSVLSALALPIYKRFQQNQSLDPEKLFWHTLGRPSSDPEKQGKQGKFANPRGTPCRKSQNLKKVHFWAGNTSDFDK